MQILEGNADEVCSAYTYSNNTWFKKSQMYERVLTNLKFYVLFCFVNTFT